MDSLASIASKERRQKRHPRLFFATTLLRRWRRGGNGKRREAGAGANATGAEFTPTTQGRCPPGASNQRSTHREGSVYSAANSASTKQPPSRVSPFPVRDRAGSAAAAKPEFAPLSAPSHPLAKESSEREVMTEPRRSSFKAASGYGEPALSPVVSNSVSFSERSYSYRTASMGEGSSRSAPRELGGHTTRRAYYGASLERSPPRFSSNKTAPSDGSTGKSTNYARAGRVVSGPALGTVRPRGGGAGGTGGGELRGGFRRGQSAEVVAAEPRIPIEAYEQAGRNFAVYVAIQWRHHNGESGGSGGENGFTMLARLAEVYGRHAVRASFPCCRPEAERKARRRGQGSNESQQSNIPMQGSWFRTARQIGRWWATGKSTRRTGDEPG